MVKELQALCLDIRVLDEAGEVVDLSTLTEDDSPAYANIEDVNRAVDNENKGDADGDEDLEDGDDDFDGVYDDDEFDSEEDEYAFDEEDEGYDDSDEE